MEIGASLWLLPLRAVFKAHRLGLRCRTCHCHFSAFANRRFRNRPGLLFNESPTFLLKDAISPSTISFFSAWVLKRWPFGLGSLGFVLGTSQGLGFGARKSFRNVGLKDKHLRGTIDKRWHPLRCYNQTFLLGDRAVHNILVERVHTAK